MTRLTPRAQSQRNHELVGVMSALFGCFLGFRSNSYRGRTNCFTRQSERFRRKANKLFSEASKQNSLGHKIKTKLFIDTSNPTICSDITALRQSCLMTMNLRAAKCWNVLGQKMRQNNCQIGNKTSQIDIILSNNSQGLMGKV